MASYKKYVIIGLTTILLPLGKWVLQKAMSRLPEPGGQDSDAEALRSSLTPGGNLRGEYDNVETRE